MAVMGFSALHEMGELARRLIDDGDSAWRQIDPADRSGWDVDKHQFVPIRRNQHLVLDFFCDFALSWHKN